MAGNVRHSGKPVGVLADTNIWLSTVTHECVYSPQTLHWGNSIITVDVATHRPRRLRNKTQEESNKVYADLKQVADLVKSRNVTLYESDEVLLEGLNLRHPTLRGTEFDVFRGITHERARAPMPRTFIIDSTYSPKEARDNWHKILSKIDHPRFLELKKKMSVKHLADLYHVWEAEHNKLQFFMTLDVKFVHAVSYPHPLKSSVKVCTPSELVRLLCASEARPR